MYQRQMAPELAALANSYPIVTVTGPRQSGKTTLVRHQFPNKPYVTLEPLDIREMASRDPRQFFESLSNDVGV